MNVRCAPTAGQKNGPLNCLGRRNGMPALRVWHRRPSLVTAVVVLPLAVTAILLIQALSFGLHPVRVAAHGLLRWYRSPPVEKEEAPELLVERLPTAERGRGLSVERLLQDVHSGCVVGSWGPRFVDAAAIVFVILAIASINSWWTRRGRVPVFPKPDGKRRKSE